MLIWLIQNVQILSLILHLLVESSRVFFIIILFAVIEIIITFALVFAHIYCSMKHNGVRQISSLLMLFVLVSYMVCVTICSHVHFVDNHSVIHSHPYTNQNHSHSNSECNAIANLSSFYGCDISQVDFIAPVIYSFAIPYAEYECDVTYFTRFYKSLRSPPSQLIFS